jgi:hypothetical protein
MKKLFIFSVTIVNFLVSQSQCTDELAAKQPYSSIQSNAFKYIGKNGMENKANTDKLYKKMLDIYSLFEETFKNYSGVVCKWKAQVDNMSNEGLVKGYMEIYLQQLTCNKDGSFNKNSGSIPLEIDLFINGFEPWVVRDEQKAFGFTAANKKDSLNGQLLYLIAEKQEEEGFKGFPLYYKGWNNRPNQSVVIITKPDLPLFQTITIKDFIGLFRIWTAKYHPEKQGSSFEVTPAKIDKFVQSNSKAFFEKPCITLWNRENQIVYIRRSTFVENPTQGNPWVIINPGYINKDAAPTSLQFISMEMHVSTDDLSSKYVSDFKKNFDFKKLQGMLGK